MIIFNNKDSSKPYSIFHEYYLKALENNQPNADAICVSSYSKEHNFVDSRFVNLKLIDGEDFIFFSNYNSPKARQYDSHNQISISIFWHSINIQVRLKAIIKKTSNDFNQLYFKNRSQEKNALAISSFQSKPISSFQEVKDKYQNILKHSDVGKCPDYWGGYSFKPYVFEFWEGNKFRLNKRNLYSKEGIN